MKVLLTTIFLLFPSFLFGDWTRVGTGDTYNIEVYVDFDRIRKSNGKHFFWVLINIKEMRKDGVKSLQVYREGDCNLYIMKTLSVVTHYDYMGKDVGKSNNIKNPELVYPKPKSLDEVLLNKVCNF